MIPIAPNEGKQLEDIARCIREKKAKGTLDEIDVLEFGNLITQAMTKGFNVKPYFDQFEKWLQAIGLSTLLLIYAPINRICQPQINQYGQLVEVKYELKDTGRHKFLVPIRQEIVKERATHEDLKNYKCKPIIID
ncbi:hypothetical protein HYX00_05875 [Candidatus Woesearchaeota archaeon]|nr:hypothetical protein [Candidatus Woesearchaeota archaeon]